MKKINNKGFMMLETLVVSVFIVTILTYLYIQFVNLKSNYSISFRYDTVENLYKTEEIDKFINENIGYQKMFDIGDNEIYVNNKCNLSYFSSVNDYCEELMDKLDLKTAILITPDTVTSDIKKYGDGIVNYTKKIIKNNTADYILVTEFNDESFASIVAYEGNSVGGYKCKRATKLHQNGNLEYGSLGTKGKLESGDAFDCDVNGDGTYDSSTERFYYVTDLEENNSYAVLIYYNKYSQAPYNIGTGNNYEGPITVTTLPTSSTWSNVKLYEYSGANASSTSEYSNEQRIYINSNLTPTITRSITSAKPNNAGTKMTFSTTVTDGSTTRTLPKSYTDYSDKAARLLRLQELVSACGDTNPLAGSSGTTSTNYFSECPYFAENVSTTNTTWYWLETPVTDSLTDVYYVGPYYQAFKGSSNTTYAVRPVIEVKKTEIKY